MLFFYFLTNFFFKFGVIIVYGFSLKSDMKDIENREQRAQEYIAEHRLDGLFKHLCELLIYNQVRR